MLRILGEEHNNYTSHTMLDRLQLLHDRGDLALWGPGLKQIAEQYELNP